ncbi:MAG: MshQ-like protein [Gammaproteobacteria bacterium]|nr:MAG: MshQ-like protein [Gammaproteobacteria bacterium]
MNSLMVQKCFVLILCLVFSNVVLGAACQDVFSAADGLNENLGTDQQLDIDPTGWPVAQAWPSSGTALSSGDYYYQGGVLPNNYALSVQAGATVRIFVDSDLSFGNDSEINRAGTAGQLLLVVDGALSIRNNSFFNGVIYARNDVDLRNNSNVEGVIASEAGIVLRQNTVFTHDQGAVTPELLGDLCSPLVDLLVEGQSLGPVNVNVGDPVSLSVETIGCTDPGGLYSRQWREVWTVDGALLSQTNYTTASSCDRSPVTLTTSFPAAGTFEVAVEVEYRDCFLGFFCGAAQSYGQDRMDVVAGRATTCFSADYSVSSLDPADWITSVSSGSFTPTAVNGRLRMTEARANQSTAATLQRLLPGANNLVILEFDYYAYGGSGADGIAVVLSDAAVTPQPGSFGGSLGYAQRDNGDSGFAGGWLGVGIDEYGNFSAPTEGRQGGPRRIQDSVSIRGSGSGTSGYRYLAGTGSLNPGIDATGANSPHRYRIVVDSRATGQALVSVERDIGSGYQELIAPFNALAETGQAAVPENFLLSLTGSTGGSTNIHELDDFQLCALQLNPMGARVDHFEIVHDGVALTCQPESVMVRACSDASCNTLFTDPVDVTLSPNGWVGGDSFTFSGGQATRELQKTSPGTVSLGVAASRPPARAFSQTLCDNGSGLDSGNCGLEFFDAGLAFDIPDLTSHRPESPVQVRAVRRDDQSDACVPAFENEQKSVKFWSTYVDPGPNGRPVSRQMSIDGIAIGSGQGSATSVDLQFGAGGVAEIEVQYPDAGLLNLDARYVGSTATGDDGLILPGADSFVSVPAGFCVASAGDCAAGDASCAAFRKAGQVFDLKITAVGWESDADSALCTGNPATPNFRLLTIPLSASLEAPVGGAPGVVSPASYSHTRSVSATETVATEVSEVGIFRFDAQPAAGSYLGRDVPGGTSLPVGRFYPDRFNVAIDAGELGAACNSGVAFVYTGQSFTWMLPPQLRIQPLSVQGGVTRNYTFPGFQKLVASDIDRLYPVTDQMATDQSGALSTITTVPAIGTLTTPTSTLGNGELRYDFSLADRLVFDKTALAQVAPFRPQLSWSVTDVSDSDGVSADGAPYVFSPLANFEIRYGRWAMENVYGPENIAELTMPYRLEYWNGARFARHAADSCSGWDTSFLSNTENHHALDSTAPSSGIFSLGQASPLRLIPDGTTGTDTLVWDVDSWLEYDWDGDGANEDPTGLATFGVYRGHDRVIYWRER